MRNKIIAIALGITTAFTMAAGGSQTQTSAGSSTVSEISEESAETVESSTEVLTGGWEINQSSTDPEDSSNKEAKEAFEKATEDLDGYDYELIACLGSQTVAGTNYSYLVKGTPVTPDGESEYTITVVYEDLEGTASITASKGLLEVSDDKDAAEGSWSYNQGSASVDDNAQVKEALDRALENLTGAEYEPVAYIGSQVVAGTNYMILCRVTPVTPDAQGTFCLVTVYEDLDGNAEITDTSDVDLSADAS